MNKIYSFLFAISLICLSANAQTFKQINIEIAPDSIAQLEANPYSNDDVHGNFVVDGQRFENVELHYRGAYYLFTLIREGNLRNWKVKFPKANKFEDRREWNFNYENYIRQNLAYHTFRQANVPVVSSENVILSVNGQRQGLYLKYEDPDNSDWLKETFGDNDGDLYKAAFDQPGQTKYFADLTYLGDRDEDYFWHYRKQTNKKDETEFDYSSIRDFTRLINETPDAAFEQTILNNFAVEEFIEYLVVSNFISNWDSYPYRPKNFFLYDNPEDGKWHFIPWDLDGTFQEGGNRNQIGTRGSIFRYFDGVESYNSVATEPLDRPLVWRIMDIDRFRDKYCYEYKKAIETYLSEDYLEGIIDSISATVAQNTSGAELGAFNSDVTSVKRFITRRMQNVTSQLNGCEVTIDPFSSTQKIDNQGVVKIYPNPSFGNFTIKLPESESGKVKIEIVDLVGKNIFSKERNLNLGKDFRIETRGIPSGQYFIKVNTEQNIYSNKLLIF